MFHVSKDCIPVCPILLLHPLIAFSVEEEHLSAINHDEPPLRKLSLYFTYVNNWDFEISCYNFFMKRICINELEGHIGKEVVVAGFVHTLRVQSKIIFLILRDITGIIQTVVEASSEAFPIAQGLSHESVVRIKGTLKTAPQAPGGSEINVSEIEVLSVADPELPIPVVNKGNDNEAEAPVRFDYRWIDLRRPEKAHIFKVWTELEKGFRKYWDKHDFIQVYPPNFLETQSESGAEVFTVNYFDRKAYLPQSPQFYKQMAMASGLETVL